MKSIHSLKQSFILMIEEFDLNFGLGKTFFYNKIGWHNIYKAIFAMETISFLLRKKTPMEK